MLAQKRPAVRIFGIVLDVLAGMNATSGGSRETDVNEPTVIPVGHPSPSVAVMATTAVGTLPSTSRK
jgi:hypothetical protein